MPTGWTDPQSGLTYTMGDVFLTLASHEGRVAPLQGEAHYLQTKPPHPVVWFLAYYMVEKKHYERAMQGLRRPVHKKGVQGAPVLIQKVKGFMPGARHTRAAHVVVLHNDGWQRLHDGEDPAALQYTDDYFCLYRDYFIEQCRGYGDGACYLLNKEMP